MKVGGREGREDEDVKEENIGVENTMKDCEGEREVEMKGNRR